MDLTAEKDVTITSTENDIDINAGQERDSAHLWWCLRPPQGRQYRTPRAWQD
ncbi:hypothetical protein CU110_09545 [Cobetia sp. ICG0124]|nr:hypothetical protein CU110_09545 [Cobetia sp. ICG0124]